MNNKFIKTLGSIAIITVAFNLTSKNSSCKKMFEACTRVCVLDKEPVYSICMQDCIRQFNQCRDKKK